MGHHTWPHTTSLSLSPFLSPYVTDVCVVLLSRNEPADVCKIIDVLVEYMIEKNIVMCVKFLQYLDIV